MRAAPSKLLLVGLELKLVLACCLLYRLLIYLMAYISNKMAQDQTSFYREACSGFIVFISMVKCWKKAFEIMFGY